MTSLNSNPIPYDKLDPVWEGVFSEDEKVLWRGRPDHGREFWEFEGHEPVLYWSLLIGGFIIWPVGILVPDHSIDTVIFQFAFLSFVTVGGFAFFYYSASSRSYVMSNLFYAVSDQRAVILRRGKNYRMAQRRYVLSFPYEARYAFIIHPGRRLSSVQVGSLLGEE